MGFVVALAIGLNCCVCVVTCWCVVSLFLLSSSWCCGIALGSRLSVVVGLTKCCFVLVLLCCCAVVRVVVVILVI